MTEQQELRRLSRRERLEARAIVAASGSVAFTVDGHEVVMTIQAGRDDWHWAQWAVAARWEIDS